MLQAVFATGAGSLARAEPRLVARLNTRPLSAAAMSFRAQSCHRWTDGMR